MQKKILITFGGVNFKVADLLVNRLIPGNGIKAVGPFVFLDHVYPVSLGVKSSSVPTGEFAHPHRGITTFSYVFQGSLAHYDSVGNHSVIHAGEIQWMKAGNGIIHDEQPISFSMGDKIFHSIQFWINLPSDVKKEQPEYMAIKSDQVPEINLPDNSGVLRILLGELGSNKAHLRTFNNEFIYHLKLNPKSTFSFPSRDEFEYGALATTTELIVNQVVLKNSKIAIFENSGQIINIENPNVHIADAIIFGGLPYNEAIVSEGPFVMNSREEIAQAYRDFFEGKYGEIKYTNA